MLAPPPLIPMLAHHVCREWKYLSHLSARGVLLQHRGDRLSERKRVRGVRLCFLQLIAVVVAVPMLFFAMQTGARLKGRGSRV